MIITSSNKPLRIIGIASSTITQEVLSFLPTQTQFEYALITPNEFLILSNKHDYQYLVFFTLDVNLRKEIIDIIETLGLECFSGVHESAIIHSSDLRNLSSEEIFDIIGRGTIISPFSSVMINAKLGNHCILETYCLVSHYCTIGNNVILHSGTMIAGRTAIGNNCEFNFKSAVLNALNICDDVEVGAISTVTKDITQPGRYIGTIARYAGERIPFDG
jgi:carbonic anhydrase/acetyltransferase-like protein (isoleucine patch superfamily)